MNLEESLTFMKETGALPRFIQCIQHIKPEYFYKPHGIHGINHTKRVLFLVELLAALENLDEPERDILSMAAVYHDIGRTNDGVDLGHGYSSFRKAEQMGLIHMKNPEDYNIVRYLIEAHCINDQEAFALVKDYGLQEPEKGKRLLMFFKDADGLDRVRIDDLNPAMLRLPVSRELVAVAEELYFNWDISGSL